MIKRPYQIILITCILLSLFFGAALPVSAQDDAIIRVYLRRLKLEDTAEIVLQGEYMLDDRSMYFPSGTTLNVSLRDSELVLHTAGVAVRIGESMKLIRCQGEQTAGMTINGNGLYEGDLLITPKDGVLMPVLYIHIEDYLLGVVPYEMGDSFPLEALKAQAIAARTYALRKRGASEEYDVEDTTNDQAYRGRNTSSPLSEQAVRETEGLCGMYQGALAKCYYSASNGGQTELAMHVWPTTGPDPYGYMDMRDDPYDLENDASVVKRFALAKDTRKNGIAEPLHQVLVAALADELRAIGKQPEADCVRIDKILDVSLSEQKFEGDSRLMTQMQFTIGISVRDCLYRPEKVETADPAVSLAAPGQTPAPTNTPQPVTTPAYTDFGPISHSFTVTLPVFPTVEKAMELSINTTQNELLTVTDIGSAYMIEARRYGHGVGMSQRGAEQMANKYGMSFQEILTFYYPGMNIEQIDLARKPLQTPDMLLKSTPNPTPSPTPRPTLMPVTNEALPKGSHLSVVEHIAEDSSLNLREAPSLSSEVLRRLYKGQKLIVLNVSKDGWAQVK